MPPPTTLSSTPYYLQPPTLQTARTPYLPPLDRACPITDAWACGPDGRYRHPLVRNNAGGTFAFPAPRLFAPAARQFWDEANQVTDRVIAQYRSRLRLRPSRGAPCGWVHGGRSVSPAYPTREGAELALEGICSLRRAALLIALCDPRLEQHRADVGLHRRLPWHADLLSVLAGEGGSHA